MTTGIIFYGPSGTGKTLLARCLATAVDADVYAIKMTDLANTAYINEGAKNVQDLFKYLRNQASKNPGKKLIVIFDELDALFKNRENRNSSGEDTKVVNTFLTEMDGFDTLKNVIIVGTTNRLESLDNAVKRPGRLGTHIKVDLPSKDERAKIFQIHI
jgi:SpoVK/Ycf46/Vps4 family AAA+-type ATPase